MVVIWQPFFISGALCDPEMKKAGVSKETNIFSGRHPGEGGIQYGLKILGAARAEPGSS